MALCIGLLAPIQRTASVFHIPLHVLQLPVVVQFFVSKQVVERYLPARLRVLQVRCQLENGIGQLPAVHLLVHVVHIVEQRLHQRLAMVVFVFIHLQACLHCRIHAMSLQWFVVIHHIVGVVVRRIVMNAQPGHHTRYLHQCIFHRQDAAHHCCTLRIQCSVALKHFGKSFHHASGYLPLLLGTYGSQLAPSSVGFVTYHAHTFQHVLAQRRQLTQ